jgi:hypothetical protein
MTLFNVTATVGIGVFFVILITLATGVLLLVSIGLVVLRFVSASLSRFVFPTIGECDSTAAKDGNDSKNNDRRRFHFFPPNEPHGIVKTGKFPQIIKICKVALSVPIKF